MSTSLIATIMANQLRRQDIDRLKSVFPDNHHRFQVLSSTCDNIVCRFLGQDDRQLDIRVNMPDDYPKSNPFWYLDPDSCRKSNAGSSTSSGSGTELDETIFEAVSGLLTLLNQHGYHYLLAQAKILIQELCEFLGVPVPEDDFKKLFRFAEVPDATTPSLEKSFFEFKDERESEASMSSIESGDEETEEGKETLMNELIDSEVDKNQDAYDGMRPKHAETLNMVYNRYRLEGANELSPMGTNRLMGELLKMYKSDSVKNNVMDVELVDESLYEWNVKLFGVNQDSELAADLKKLKEMEGTGYILLNVTFKGDYPFEPPFVRLVKPTLINGIVLPGGALCLELLAKKGWNCAYSMEAAILQIAASLGNRNTRIVFDDKSGLQLPTMTGHWTQYSLESAQKSFEHVEKTWGVYWHSSKCPDK